ncbi:hypothetical protein AQ490_25760 [Wenjunlia vitaminophila]|uniref:PucR family transcriptional regulator n=1 Tax=Wenjunlia vitaminophila TaxID=76728 RepID=A0A0T6LQA3_WENVI|nr:helix-turn-helix domain-containing protein [Wenjunlia vitaminophila]KRV48213.1 hypothetical protein AQ490_25760 [Wenjunlia vitaminophila]
MPTHRATAAVTAVPEAPSDRLSPARAAALRDRGLRTLSSHRSTLTQRVVASLRSTEEAYRGSRFPAGELAPWIDRSLSRGLAAFRVRPEERAATCDWASELGHARARQGVPLDSMLRAYHTGGQVLCLALMRWAAEEDLASSPSALLVDDVWNIVDLHCAAAVRTFRAAEAEAGSGDGRVGAFGSLLDTLLNGESDPAFCSAVARGLALPEHGRYAVVVERPAPGGGPVVAAELPGRVAGVRTIWRMHGECAIGLAVLGETAPSALVDALPTAPGRCTGVSLDVSGLSELGTARRLAELAARTVTSREGAACLADELPAALLVVRPDLAGELSQRTLAPVLALEPSDRDLLLATLKAWLDADGASSRAATALYCHRNTVLNRLRRLERLTRRSLSVPRDLVELSLALQAHELLSTGH